MLWNYSIFILWISLIRINSFMPWLMLSVNGWPKQRASSQSSGLSGAAFSHPFSSSHANVWAVCRISGATIIHSSNQSLWVAEGWESWRDQLESHLIWSCGQHIYTVRTGDCCFKRKNLLLHPILVLGFWSLCWSNNRVNRNVIYKDNVFASTFLVCSCLWKIIPRWKHLWDLLL